MVKRKRLRNYLDKQFNGMKENLNQVSEVMDDDKLHDLRLNAKKVKAVSGFLKESLNDKKKYSVKELSELFHITGDIRTAQLNLKAVEDYEIKSEAFKKEQIDVIKNDSKELVGKRKKYNKNISSVRKKIRENSTAIKNKSAIDFYNDNIKVLSNNLKLIDENNLHDSRKIIKKLLYSLKLLPASLMQKLNVNKDYLDKMQDLIGNWHDTAVTVDLLTKAGAVEDEHLAALKKKKQDQFENIIQETKDFDNNIRLSKAEN